MSKTDTKTSLRVGKQWGKRMSCFKRCGKTCSFFFAFQLAQGHSSSGTWNMSMGYFIQNHAKKDREETLFRNTVIILEFLKIRQNLNELNSLVYPTVFNKTH